MTVFNVFKIKYIQKNRESVREKKKAFREG